MEPYYVCAGIVKHKTRLKHIYGEVWSWLKLGQSLSQNQLAASWCFGAKKEAPVAKQIVQKAGIAKTQSVVGSILEGLT